MLPIKPTTVPVISVKRKADDVVCKINAADFDDALHVKLGATEAAAAKEPEVEKAEASLKSKTIAELRAIAADLNVDLTEANTKAQIIAAIEAAGEGD